MRGLFWAGLAALALWAAPAAAELEDMDFDLETTRDLYDVCSARVSQPLGVEAEVACFSYFAGASHFHRAMVGPQVVPLFCPPETAMRADAINVFVAWARANENDEALMGELPVEGVMRAIIAEYPCP